MAQVEATRKNSMTRDAIGEELDLRIDDADGYHKHDKYFTMQGKTISFTGLDLPADDSYLYYMAGDSLMPNGLRITGINAYNTNLINPTGFNELLHTDVGFEITANGSRDLAGITVGNSLLLSQFTGQNLGGTAGSLLLYAVLDETVANYSSAWSYGSMHLGFQEQSGVTTNSGTTVAASGAQSGGQIVWDPPGYHYGVGIGNGFGGSVKYALISANSGWAYFPTGATFLKGTNLQFQPADTSQNGQPFFTATNGYLLTLGNAGGGCRRSTLDP